MSTRKYATGATIWDVAKESNVSIATVSHVINNGPRTVRPDTRERVLCAIAKLNYHPNAMARGLVRRCMNTVGVLSGVFEARQVVVNPYASGILQGILNQASEAGWDVLLFTEGWENLQTSGHVYRDRRADGMITIAPTLGSDMISGLASLDLAVVGISADSLSVGTPSVDVDNRKGVRLAVEHLISLGHRRIAHFAGNDDLYSGVCRRDAFLEVMADHGLPVPEHFMVPLFYAGTMAYELTTDLLSRPDRPTAIFAANDGIAIGVVYAARDMGVSVPGQLSVVGFDDLNTIEHLTPKLTTVHQPLASIGALATKVLIDGIKSGESEAIAHVLEPTLMVRGSTAPPHG